MCVCVCVCVCVCDIIILFVISAIVGITHINARIQQKMLILFGGRGASELTAVGPVLVDLRFEITFMKRRSTHTYIA